jgi:hypothetical protein
VLCDEVVIGHLTSKVTKTVYRHLRTGMDMHADVYVGTETGWRNIAWFNTLLQYFEIGIRVKFLYASRDVFPCSHDTKLAE